MTYFSPDYFTARSRWRTTATLHGGRLESYPIDAVVPSHDRQPHQQQLTIDVASFGNPSATKALVISSGLHGVEGLFGAAVQLATIEQYVANQQLPSDLQLVMIHILNPFGCAAYRRCNEDNIDLNRNFLVGDDVYQGCPPAYPALDGFFNPRSAPTRFEPFLLKSLALIGRHGMSALKNTLPVGQYEFPQGLFFGGNAPSQTQTILATQLRSWLGAAQQVIHLDFHSGLGKWGNYQLFAELTRDSARYDWLTDRFAQLVTLDAADRAYQPRGTFGRWCQSEFADLTYDFILAEFGTYSMLRVLKALRAENRGYWWGDKTAKSANWTQQALLEVFVPTSDRWRKIALERGVTLCGMGIDALQHDD
jgi:predicted deacylase